MRKLNWFKGLEFRKGSTTILALMISLMLMLLVTASMALTMVDARVVMDYARNQKAFEAADSGVVHGNVTLSRALSAWHLPPATTIDQVDQYATDAESGIRSPGEGIPPDNVDLPLLLDSAENMNEVLDRGDVTTSGSTETSSTGMNVDYDSWVDIEPIDVDRPDTTDITHTTVFHYDYSVTGQGDAVLGGLDNRATRREVGAFEVEVQRPSFSTYGYFTNSMKNQFNQQLVFFDGEVYGGKTHVNAAPPEGRAGFYGVPVFNGPFSAVQARYEDSWLGGNANPQFNAGATWGADVITLPANAWSQARAALGDYDNITSTDTLTDNQVRSLLNLQQNGQPVDNGVYYSQGNGASTANVGSQLNGGIYIKGSPSSVQFTENGTEQIMTITMTAASGQFAGTHTWQFYDNKAGKNSRVYFDGTLARSFTSALNGMIQVEGDVLALKGDTGSTPATTPDIQSNEQITVSATGNIFISSHITYADDPVTNINAKNIFGIFSSGGNIYLAQIAPNDIKLNASVMASGTNRGVGAEGIIIGGNYNYNYPDKGFWNLLGGLIENKNQTTGVYYSNGKRTGYRWNFTYDERFAHGVAPPYFPYVTQFTATMQNKHAVQWERAYYNQ